MRRLGTLAICLVALALLPGTAAAKYDPIGSGATRLKLDKGFLALMKRNGVAISARAPAKLKNGVVTFPADGGKFDPTTKKGTVEHDGVLILKAKRGVVSFKRLQLKTTRKSSPLSARVGGGQLKLGTTRGLRVARAGFGESLAVPSLKIAAKVSARLDKRLHLQVPVPTGQLLGSASTVVEPSSVSILAGGRVGLELDPAFAAKLDQLHVAVNPIFPAEHTGTPFTFAIFGGRIAPDLSSGMLETQGGLELLQLGGGQVIWSEPRIDLDGAAFSPEVDVEPAPPYAGKTGIAPVAALNLAAARKVDDSAARTIELGNGALTLSAATAATLNEVFARPQGKDGVFAAAETLGRLAFVAQGQ
jgi:hypothetical protein